MMTLTRDKLESIIEDIKVMSDYPWHHKLNFILKNDQAQRVVIGEQQKELEWLKERDEVAKWYETLVTRTKIGTKDTPSLKAYIEQVEAKIEQQAKENKTLREALHVAVKNLRAWNGEETWDLYRKSPEIQVIEQALKEVS